MDLRKDTVMKDELRKYITDETSGYYKENQYLTLVKNCIPGNGIPDKMKTAIACSEIVTLATHFRALVRIAGGDTIPVNAITFVIAESGGGKDMAVKAARKGFKSIYSKMDKFIQEQAITRANKEAEENNSDDFMEYYKKPRPLFQGSDPTMSGIIAHMNELQDSQVGGGHVFTGEFATELANGNTMIELLKFAAEIYDTGDLKASSRKSTEAQNEEIKNINFSALFVTSPDNIIYDQTIKKKFLVEFTSKLARRSILNFNRGKAKPISETVKELIARENRELQLSIDAVQELTTVTSSLKPKPKYIIGIDDGIWDLYNVTKKYNELWSDEIDPVLESYRLSIKHLQWKTLKIAGAYAFIDGRTSITRQDFGEALHFCESLVSDIKDFNEEINKESYELLDDYMDSIYKNHKIELTAHKLSKLGYIDSTKSVKSKLVELCDMANDISKGVYTAEGTKIHFERLVQKDVIGASYKVSKGSKEDRAKTCKDGFVYKELPFARVENLLKNDTAYCPFEFKDGIRANDNIVGGTKLVILDIDESDVTDYEMHDMLEEYKHHIARTSDKDNPFKFRIALELDSYVTVDAKNWKKFLESISIAIGVEKVDSLPISQIYFGYEGRDVLSNPVGELFPSKEHLIYANKEVEKKVVPSKVQAKNLLSDAISTFWYLFEATSGSHSTSMIRAAKHAKDLGATCEEVKDLMQSAQDYWVSPLEEERFQRTIIKQIERLYE